MTILANQLQIVVIGAGGVGSTLVPDLARYLQYRKDVEASITVIDGDHYTSKNAERQLFSQVNANKAETTVRDVAAQFDRVDFEAVGEYVTPDNIDFFIESGRGTVVLVCVDNHKTRKLIDDFCGGLDDAVLLNGGNELTDGNVQVYIRRGGKDVTASMSSVHPEIANPRDKSPHEMNCEEQAQSSTPQLFFANRLVSALMCVTLYALMEHEGPEDQVPYGELFFDMTLGRVNPLERKPTV